MKKINKRGFTLIEMLVVLVLLVVIMSIAIPSITSSVERSKEKDRKAKQDLAVAAGELYIDEHKNIFNGDRYDGVKISKLIRDGYLPGIKATTDICSDGECCIKSNKLIDDGEKCQLAYQ